VPELATVRFWIRRFTAYGPAGWADAPRRGRPRPLGPHGLKTRLTLRPDAPRNAGDLAPFWTIAMRAVAVLHPLGVPRSTSTLRGMLRMRTTDFLALLDHLLGAYPPGPIRRMVDNFSRHTAHAVGPWLTAHPRVHVYDWPRYGSEVIRD
jgi:hypothetical protein